LYTASFVQAVFKFQGR